MRAIVLYVLSAIKEYEGVRYHTKTHIFDFLRQFIMSGPEMALFLSTPKKLKVLKYYWCSYLTRYNGNSYAR
jgi:hypothetical protein